MTILPIFSFSLHDEFKILRILSPVSELDEVRNIFRHIREFVSLKSMNNRKQRELSFSWNNHTEHSIGVLHGDFWKNTHWVHLLGIYHSRSLGQSLEWHLRVRQSGKVGGPLSSPWIQGGDCLQGWTVFHHCSQCPGGPQHTHREGWGLWGGTRQQSSLLRADSDMFHVVRRWQEPGAQPVPAWRWQLLGDCPSAVGWRSGKVRLISPP